MTLRHWTGSSRLIDLFHGFGHCASHSYVLEHDTALAELQLRSNRIIPDGFQKARSLCASYTESKPIYWLTKRDILYTKHVMLLTTADLRMMIASEST